MRDSSQRQRSGLDQLELLQLGLRLELDWLLEKLGYLKLLRYELLRNLVVQNEFLLLLRLSHYSLVQCLKHLGIEWELNLWWLLGVVSALALRYYCLGLG